MTMRRVLLTSFVVLTLLPAPALAGAPNPPLPAARLVTVDQVIAMTKAGVSDAVILALIGRDRPIFLLDVAQTTLLRQKGVSEPLLQAMIVTGYYWQLGYYGQTLPCAASAVTPPPPRAGSSTSGISFTQPTRGIFFAPPSRSPCR